MMPGVSRGSAGGLGCLLGLVDGCDCFRAAAFCCWMSAGTSPSFRSNLLIGATSKREHVRKSSQFSADTENCERSGLSETSKSSDNQVPHPKQAPTFGKNRMGASRSPLFHPDPSQEPPQPLQTQPRARKRPSLKPRKVRVSPKRGVKPEMTGGEGQKTPHSAKNGFPDGFGRGVKRHFGHRGVNAWSPRAADPQGSAKIPPPPTAATCHRCPCTPCHCPRNSHTRTGDPAKADANRLPLHQGRRARHPARPRLVPAGDHRQRQHLDASRQTCSHFT